MKNLLVTPFVLILAMLLATSPPPASAAVQDAPKLDYRDQEKLKNAQGYLKDIAGWAPALEQWVEKYGAMDAVNVPGDQLVIFDNTITEIEKRRGYIVDYLNQLPRSHPDVQTLDATLNMHMATIDRVKKAKAKIAAAQGEATNPENLGDWQADLEIIGEVAKPYRDYRELFYNNPTQATALAKGYPDVKRELLRVAETYAPLINAGTPEGEQLRKRLEYNDKKLTDFVAAAREHEQFQVDQAKAFLDDAEESIEMAVREQRPAWLKEDGGVEQRLQEAMWRIELLAAIQRERARPIYERYQKIQQQLAEGRVALRAEMVNNNRVPSDAYSGSDADALKQKMRDAWLAEFPEDEILAVTLTMSDWKRETKWEWDGRDTFDKVDVSRLQGQVVVRDNATEAMMYPVHFRKNHMQNDAMSVTPWGKEDHLAWRMLIENIE